jgi:hypothetical protein
MVIITPQQIIEERISFLKEQINHSNKPEINSTFQIPIDAIRSVDDIEKVESIIVQKKALLKNSKDVQETDNIFLPDLPRTLRNGFQSSFSIASVILKEPIVLLPIYFTTTTAIVCHPNPR